MKQIIFLLFLILSTSFSFDDPREAVINHLANLQENSYKPKQSAKSLSKIEKEINYQKAAIRLKKFFDAKGLYVLVDDISDNPNYVDSTKNKQVLILFEDYPKIYLEKISSKWLYSRETVANINNLYKQIFPEEIQGLLSRLPESFFIRVIGLEIWKWLGILAFFIFALILYFLLNKIIAKYTFKVLSRFNKGERLNHYISRVVSPISLLILLQLLEEYFPYLQLHVKVSNNLDYIIHILKPVLATVMVYRLTDLFGDIFQKYADVSKSKVDDQLVPLVRKTLKIIVFIIGGFYIVDSLGVDITPLLAGASVGGLAIALAAQDTMKNFFGSITIFTDKPFDVGDWIKFGSDEGTVEEVGVRSTRVRTFHNSLVSIPNGRIADMALDNMGRRHYRRYFTNLLLKYNTDPDKIQKFVYGLKKIVAGMKDSRKDYYEINLNGFTTYGLEILVYIFFSTDNWTAELAAKQEFIFKTLNLAKELEIEFAYPTQDIRLEYKDENNRKKNEK